ncbi:MAG: hypothetical protein FVQ77_12630 [Cytophagales bacterium]|nr:hypothetical protein [Cytophagales bacterium]
MNLQKQFQSIINLFLAQRVFIILSVSLLLQLYIASWPDTMGDVELYRSWCRTLVNEGLEASYWGEPHPNGLILQIDYPPVYPYMIYIIGNIHQFISADSFQSNDILVDFLLKLPAIFSNIIISLLIYFFLKKQLTNRDASLAMMFYALNPAIIFDTAYWGQTDAFYSVFILLSLLYFMNKKPELSWVFITIGVFTKPLVLPFAPLIAIFTWRDFGLKRTFKCTVTSVITTIIIFIPFLYLNKIEEIIYSLFFQLEAMPYISVNAHNIWWIIGAGLPWIDASTKILGGMSFKSTGIILFSLFYIISIIKFWRSKDGLALFYLFASVALGFFMLSTHMHENHLFAFFPLVSMFVIYDQRIKWVYVIFTLTYLANMVLHDPFIVSSGIFNMGKILYIPYGSGGNISLFRLALTILNSLIGLYIFFYWIFHYYLSEDKHHYATGKYKVILAITFICGAILPLILKARTFKNEPFNLNNAVITTNQDNNVDLTSFSINNDNRQVIYAHPPTQITYNNLEISEQTGLTFGFSLHPQTWNPEKGDGVLFEISVQIDNKAEMIFSKYIDPKKNTSDREWHDYQIDLSKYKGKEISITFITSPGQANNSSYDWAGWSQLRLISINDSK